MTHARRQALKSMLEQRRRDLQATLYGKMQEVRREGPDAADRANSIDDMETRIHEDIDLALIQINAETVKRITDALVRLDIGQYGRCLDCEEDIAEKRLQALPFANRCKNCQEVAESAHVRRQTGLRGDSPFGPGFSAYGQR